MEGVISQEPKEKKNIRDDYCCFDFGRIWQLVNLPRGVTGACGNGNTDSRSSTTTVSRHVMYNTTDACNHSVTTVPDGR